jgi:hypothetical protein
MLYSTLNEDRAKICDWIQIQITFRTTCIECHKEILPGRAFWSNSEKAAIHLNCSNSAPSANNIRSLNNLIAEESKPSHTMSTLDTQIIELKCFICGSKTGCTKCEYLIACEQRVISKYCICDQCITKHEDSFNIYQEYFTKKLKFLK